MDCIQVLKENNRFLEQLLISNFFNLYLTKFDKFFIDSSCLKL